MEAFDDSHEERAPPLGLTQIGLRIARMKSVEQRISARLGMAATDVAFTSEPLFQSHTNASSRSNARCSGFWQVASRDGAAVVGRLDGLNLVQTILANAPAGPPRRTYYI
jgi:hypothetical protein